MAQIGVQILNDTSDNWNVHVFDRFAQGRREVQDSPFALAVNETSPQFGINADADGMGKLEWRADGGPSLDNVEVRDGTVVTMR